MSTAKENYEKTIKSKLKEQFKYANNMRVAKLEKIVLNRGLGEANTNSKAIEITFDQFKLITGQKPVLTKAKKSISNFKLREEQVIGCKVTLRGEKMYDFLTKLVNIALPKIRDFRGLPTGSFDGRGNYTLGIKEDIIFAEVNYDKIDRIRGMDISFITSTDNDKEAFELLKLFGMPFREHNKGT